MRAVSGYSNMFGGINFGDYAMIRSGAYKKLAKSYYSNQSASTSRQQATNQALKYGNITSAWATQKNSSQIKAAKTLQTSANALKDYNLWSQKSVTTTDAETGKKTTSRDYDWAAITKAVENFAKDYNSMVDEASKSNDINTLRNASNMTKNTRSMSGMLEKVGVTIGSDNHMTVDTEKLKTADISTLKTLFRGSTSFAGKTAQSASNMQISSQSAARTSTAYGSTGAYSNWFSNYMFNNYNVGI